ncbi:carbonate dehydratase [Halomonas sp.]|uniref:carbonate dehydratase n=1 Tax=Halomonas sp. TaxID=1486246 RepID=UPI0025BD947E|nr:carbonate dehydratase [Halomonas sp.]
MKNEIEGLLENNRVWAEKVCRDDPAFFERLSRQQNPDYLWIGCSDSRVPANQIISLPPGEVFVHRNVANLVHHNDLNALSVLQYAIEVLGVRHVMVVGHYGCGGVRAAVVGGDNGMVDIWLHSVRELYSRHRDSLVSLPTNEQVDRICELNVEAQVMNLARTKIIQHAWQRGQEVSVHGWIYGLADGRVKDLECSIYGLDQIEALYLIEALSPAG